jgi:hypothetical protein
MDSALDSAANAVLAVKRGYGIAGSRTMWKLVSPNAFGKGNVTFGALIFSFKSAFTAVS